MAQKFFRSIFCLLTIAALMVIYLPGFAQAYTINIRAYFDGFDQLIIRQNTLQWQHFYCYPVGEYPGNHYPTYISTPTMNSVAWYPDWPNGTGFEAYSSVYSGLNPALPAGKVNVTLTPVQVRGVARIVQQPSSANNYTLKVEFDDGLPPAADWYEIQLNITPVHVTLPAMLLIMD